MKRVTVSLPDSVYYYVEASRGDLPRSLFLRRVLERAQVQRQAIFALEALKRGEDPTPEDAASLVEFILGGRRRMSGLTWWGSLPKRTDLVVFPLPDNSSIEQGGG